MKLAYKRYQAQPFIERLGELARVNMFEFRRSPSLCSKFERDLRTKNFEYVDDRLTCGRLDCWTSYRALAERYRNSPILFDCEDGAAALSGYLAAQCYSGVHVGMVPPPEGFTVAHAVSGVALKDGKKKVLDPSAWFGMGPFGRPYEPVWWIEVKG